MGANAQTAVPAFTAGQVLTAAQQTQINTGIPVFATTTTRDAAFGGTGEKVLAEGQFAYIEASNTTQYYDGAAWQTLGGGLTLIKTQTIGSAVSSVTVTDAFSSTYDNYKVTISGGVGSTDINLRIQLGSTTTGYYTSFVGTVWATNAVNGAANNNNVPYINYAGAAGTYGINMNYDLMGPYLAKRTYGCGNFNAYNAAYFSAAVLQDTTSYTAFTITPDTGTLTGGTIRVYGYQNS